MYGFLICQYIIIIIIIIIIIVVVVVVVVVNNSKSRDSSVGIATRLRAGRSRF
jgi:preprotein translocase subunit SecG